MNHFDDDLMAGSAVWDDVPSSSSSSAHSSMQSLNNLPVVTSTFTETSSTMPAPSSSSSSYIQNQPTDLLANRQSDLVKDVSELSISGALPDSSDMMPPLASIPISNNNFSQSIAAESTSILGQNSSVANPLSSPWHDTNAFADPLDTRPSSNTTSSRFSAPLLDSDPPSFSNGRFSDYNNTSHRLQSHQSENNTFAATYNSYKAPALPSRTPEPQSSIASGPFVDPLLGTLSEDQADKLPKNSPSPAAEVEPSVQQNRKEKMPESAYVFDVAVTEPTKVGNEITLNAHVTYKVRTKTNHPKYRNPEFSVTRRYRDFLWLYNQLSDRYPGAIIPPVPEKLAIGRFQTDFVESRRFGLERFISKVTSHTLFQDDEDVQAFLESETFSVDVNQRKKEENRTSFMAVFTSPIVPPTNTLSKIPDDDPYFVQKKIQIDNVESQLRLLVKAVEGIVKQRKELGAAMKEFGDSVTGLGTVEVNKGAAKNALVLGKIQQLVQEQYDKQAQYELYHVFAVVEEYVRTMGSIKAAFSARMKVYQTWQTAEVNYLRKKDALDRIKANSKIRSDKISVGSVELAELETVAQRAKEDFIDVSRLLRIELERFDRERVFDFSESLQGLLKSLVNTQREIVSLWESYFEQTGQMAPEK